jgi:hypothetical protein
VEECIRADAHTKNGGQPCPRFSTQSVGEGVEGVGEASSAAGVGLDDPGEPLREDAAGAIGLVAMEAAGVDLEAEGSATAGRVGRSAHIGTVDATRWLTTTGAGSQRLDSGDDECDSLDGESDAVETKEVAVR